MNEEYIMELVTKIDRTALLLGEITGKLCIMSQKNCTDGLKEEVENLLELVLYRVNSIFYEKKQ